MYICMYVCMYVLLALERQEIEIHTYVTLVHSRQCLVVLLRISKSCKRTDSDGFFKKYADPDADSDSG